MGQPPPEPPPGCTAGLPAAVQRRTELMSSKNTAAATIGGARARRCTRLSGLPASGCTGARDVRGTCPLPNGTRAAAGSRLAVDKPGQCIPPAPHPYVLTAAAALRATASPAYATQDANRRFTAGSGSAACPVRRSPRPARRPRRRHRRRHRTPFAHRGEHVGGTGGRLREGAVRTAAGRAASRVGARAAVAPDIAAAAASGLLAAGPDPRAVFPPDSRPTTAHPGSPAAPRDSSPPCAVAAAGTPSRGAAAASARPEPRSRPAARASYQRRAVCTTGVPTAPRQLRRRSHADGTASDVPHAEGDPRPASPEGFGLRLPQGRRRPEGRYSGTLAGRAEPGSVVARWTRSHSGSDT